MTPSPLIAISDLTFESWKFFVAHWKILLKRAAWMVLAFIPYFICLGISAQTEQNIWILPGLIILGIGSLLVWLSLTRTILPLNDPGKKSTVSASLPLTALILPTILIALITGFLNLVGILLFILPGIWISISLGFSILFLLEDNQRGMTALKSSYRLVKGRWWATFGRLLVPGLFYGIIFSVISFLMTLVPIIFTLFLGAFSLPFSEGDISSSVAIPILVVAIIFGIIWLAAYVLLQLCWMVIQQIVHVKLFHSLKASQSNPDVPTNGSSI